MYFLGIDPGYANGCLAYLFSDDSVHFIDLNKAPPFPLGLVAEDGFGLIEKVGAMPRQGISSALNFGRGIGWCEAYLAYLKIPHQLVVPAKWQQIITPKRAPMSIPKDASKTEKQKLKTQNKRMLKEDIYNFCKKRFPNVGWRSFNKDTNRADALAIALYARMLHATGL